MDGSPPGSPIPGILQARTLEWVAISFSNAWKWKVKVKSLSRVRLFATPWTAAYQAPLSMGFSRQEYWSGLPLDSLYLASTWLWHSAPGPILTRKADSHQAFCGSNNLYYTTGGHGRGGITTAYKWHEAPMRDPGLCASWYLSTMDSLNSSSYILTVSFLLPLIYFLLIISSPLFPLPMFKWKKNSSPCLTQSSSSLFSVYHILANHFKGSPFNSVIN